MHWVLLMQALCCDCPNTMNYLIAQTIGEAKFDFGWFIRDIYIHYEKPRRASNFSDYFFFFNFDEINCANIKLI